MLQMRRGDHSTKEQILFLISPNPNSQDLYDNLYDVTIYQEQPPRLCKNNSLPVYFNA